MTETQHHVLVVEDDTTIREGLLDALQAEGLRVSVAADGHQGRAALLAGGLDLVLLDLMLPGPGGLELLREFRATDSATPVLILTARGEESDKVIGLELGADDYVTKPFGLRELLARVRAHLRRRTLSTEKVAARQFSLGGAAVDLDAFQLTKPAGDVVTLSRKEAEILGCLYANRGRAVPRNDLLNEVWGFEQFVSTRTIDTHVLNLRHKIEDDPKQPVHLLTVHGVGYRLVCEDETGASTKP